MKRRLLYALPAALLMGLAGGAPGLQTTPSNIVLRAATATSGGKTEVRLRWTVTQSWLPDGGFNLYRIQNGQRTKLNAQPIKTTVQSADTMALSPSHTLDIGKTLSTANLRPAGVAETALAPFGTPAKRASSSTPVFTALRDRILTLRQAAGPALPPAEMKNQEVASTAVRDYLGKLPIAASKVVKTPTQADVVREARMQLLIGAMAHQPVAQSLGLAYNDAGVTAGAKVQYALRTMDASGKESAADDATCEITVGADPQPPAPTGIMAMQRDADSVDLRWDRLSEQQEDAFGLATYKIARVDAANPAPITVTKLPLIVGQLMGKDGPIEPMSFFHDKPVAIGAVTYQISMTDMFGRESPPTAFAFKMEDWHTPEAPMNVLANQNGGNAYVVWAEPAIAKPKFRVYRIDIEQAGAKPELLTAAPIDGRPIPASAVASGKFDPDNPVDDALNGVQDNDAIVIVNGKRVVRPPRRPVGGINAADSNRKWYEFTDANPPKDHYYRYAVTSVFPTNNRDSQAAWSASVPVPIDTPLAAPAGLAAKVTVAPRLIAGASPSPTPSAGGSAPQAATGATTVPFKTSASKLVVDKFAGKGRAMITGSTVTLTWNAVAGTKPIMYRLYRANATGYAPAPAAQPNPAPAAESGAAGGASQVKLGVTTPNTFASKLSVRKAADLKMGALAMRYAAQLVLIPDSAYALVGEQKDATTFVDQIPRSHAHYYRYRLVPYNRWGVKGAPAEISVRVPATAPPSTPTIYQLNANNAGQLVVMVRANMDEEEVVKYHVFRNNVEPHVTVTPTTINHTASAEAGGAQVLPGRPKADVTFGGRSLIATGAIADKLGAGASRFGIVRRDSLYASAMQASSPVKGPLAPGSLSAASFGNNPFAAELAQLFDPARFSEIAAVDGSTRDNNGLVNYADAKVDPKTQYGYYVVAENKDGIRSSPSAILDGSPYKANADPIPAPPTVAYQQHAAHVAWNAAPSAAGYIVERSPNPGSTFVQLTGMRTQTAYDDYSARPGKSYTYRIVVVDTAGNLSSPDPSKDRTYTIPAR